MEQLKNTTELIGLKDKNIKIKTVFKADTHITIEASLDYQPPLCPHYKSQMSKYDFQRASTIPILRPFALLFLGSGWNSLSPDCFTPQS